MPSSSRNFLLGLLWAATACRDGALDPSAANCEPLQFAERVSWSSDELPDRTKLRSQLGLAAGDLDADGHIDLFVAWPGGSFWMQNDGAGQLHIIDETLPSGDHLPAGASAAMGDLDHDGDVDIVLGTWIDEADRILWNDGAGSFTIEADR